MSSSQPIKFQNISPAKFTAILAAVQAQGATVDIAGNTGTAIGDTPLGEVQSSWSYDEASQSLTVTCLKKPFLVSDSLFQSKMQALVDSVSG